MAQSFHLYAREGSGELPQIERNAKLNDPAYYLPDEGLVNAVNVAINLGQPLLLTGEPGTGKTQLAHHLSHYFGLGKPLVFNAQTTSSARDLFYRYDALAHFQHSQTSKEVLSDAEVEKRFIRYQALGQAIRDEKRYVVLIDEIDKAPRDLPNDVLAALENLAFSVPEANAHYAAGEDSRPLLILTSNSEKNLPEPFLRRVTFYHIEFPNNETLLRILQSKTDGYSSEQLNILIDHFDKLRNGRKTNLRKKPATAELIHWVDLLRRLDFKPEQMAAGLSEADRQRLSMSYSVLAKNKEDLHQLRSQR
ncbi:MAG: MoxR family ATPase [Bacteroidota bacterium]